MFYSVSRDLTSELIIHGSCGRDTVGLSPVIGRLIFSENITSFSGKEALLAIVSENTDRETLEDARTVGIVRIAEPTSSPLGIHCPYLTVSELPRCCDGRIALLDPEGQRLFVSPDIATVNRYLPRLRRSTEEVLTSSVLKNGKRLTLAVVPEMDETDWGLNILLAPPLSEDEEELYLGILEIAEQDVSRSVTVGISGKFASASTLRAILRGAVWGELSLLICDLLTEEELTDFMRRYCRVYCELEGEKREFNGYIRRGISIATPHLLSIAHSLHGIDFFVYDLEQLLSLLCGNRTEPPEQVIYALLSTIGNITDTRTDLCHGVILGQRTISSTICRRLIGLGVSYFAAPPSHINELCRIIKD